MVNATSATTRVGLVNEDEFFHVPKHMAKVSPNTLVDGGSRRSRLTPIACRLTFQKGKCLRLFARFGRTPKAHQVKVANSVGARAFAGSQYSLRPNPGLSQHKRIV